MALSVRMRRCRRENGGSGTGERRMAVRVAKSFDGHATSHIGRSVTVGIQPVAPMGFVRHGPSLFHQPAVQLILCSHGMKLPARPLCPSRYVPIVASPCMLHHVLWGWKQWGGLVLLVLVASGYTEWTIPRCAGTPFTTRCIGPCTVEAEPAGQPIPT